MFFLSTDFAGQDVKVYLDNFRLSTPNMEYNGVGLEYASQETFFTEMPAYADIERIAYVDASIGAPSATYGEYGLVANKSFAKNFFLTIQSLRDYNIITYLGNIFNHSVVNSPYENKNMAEGNE